jgi:two-component system phosphate regulon response regulator PhoB
MALILIADDDELVREVLHKSLSEQGHAVGMVANGAEAVSAFRAKHFDLVILDCSMPEMSGIEALRQIRLSPGGAGTPILMLTARRSSMDEEIANRAGANDYLRKPFSPTQLVVRAELLLAKASWAMVTAASR